MAGVQDKYFAELAAEANVCESDVWVLGQLNVSPAEQFKYRSRTEEVLEKFTNKMVRPWTMSIAEDGTKSKVELSEGQDGFEEAEYWDFSERLAHLRHLFALSVAQTGTPTPSHNNYPHTYRIHTNNSNHHTFTRHNS